MFTSADEMLTYLTVSGLVKLVSGDTIEWYGTYWKKDTDH